MLPLLFFACTAPPSDTAPVTGPRDTGAQGCRAPASDTVHTAVASQPFASPDTGWLAWRVDGTSWTPTEPFHMGAPSTYGRVAWTSDGRVGAMAHDDGTLGLIRAHDGVVEVLEPALGGDFYASRVHIDPDDRTVWIVDGNWANNGGGLYRASLDCDTDALGPVEKVRESKLAVALLQGERTVVVAEELDGVVGGAVWSLDGPDGAVLSDHTLFDYAGSAPSDVVMGPDGTVFAADNSLWSDAPHQLAVLHPDLSLRGRVDVVDPVAVVPAPDGRALVISAYGGDELLLLGPDLSLTHVQTAPLGWSAAGLQEGPSAGLMVVSENTAVLLMRFTDDGVEELARAPLDGTAIPAVVGISP